MSLYTLAVWVTTSDGKRVREIVNPDWRMSYIQASNEATRLSQQYADLDRFYKAVNVNEIEAA